MILFDDTFRDVKPTNQVPHCRSPMTPGIAFFGPAICMLLNATIGPSLGVVAQAMLKSSGTVGKFGLSLFVC